MEFMSLSFEGVLGYLFQTASEIPDSRQASNAMRYRLSEVIVGRVLVFFMQGESFLEHQRQMQSW